MQRPMTIDDATAVVGPSVGARALSLLGVGSLLVGLSNWFTPVSAMNTAAGFVLSLGFLAVVGLAVAVVVVSRASHLARLDIGILVTALVLFAVEQVRLVMPGYDGVADEAYLGHDALHVLLRGHNPYRASFPDVALLGNYRTPLLDGTTVTKYEYPPLTLEIGWVLSHIWGPLGEPWVVCSLGMAAIAVVVFVVLPQPWRALAVPLVFGLYLFSGSASHAYPIAVAVPLLCVAAHRWTQTGANGRLGRLGVVQAVALGLACTAQQLAWLMVPFLLIAIWTVRCGELSRARATAVLARYVGVAVLVFAVLDLPFAIDDWHSWVTAMTAVFTQPAFPYGVTLVMITTIVIGHSGALAYYSTATILLFVAMLGVTAVGLRRVAAAVPVLAVVVFTLSNRASTEYFNSYLPLWLVWLFATDPAAVAASRPVRWVRRNRAPLLRTWPRRVAAVALVVLPAVLAAVLAIISPAPLALTGQHALVDKDRLVELRVAVVNKTGHIVRPSYFVDVNSHISHGYKVTDGPRQLGPHQRATVTLTSVTGPVVVAARWSIFAFSDDPGAMSSQRLRLSSAQVSVKSQQDDPDARYKQRCAVSMIEGADGSCYTAPRVPASAR